MLIGEEGYVNVYFMGIVRMIWNFVSRYEIMSWIICVGYVVRIVD